MCRTLGFSFCGALFVCQTYLPNLEIYISIFFSSKYIVYCSNSMCPPELIPFFPNLSTRANRAGWPASTKINIVLSRCRGPAGEPSRGIAPLTSRRGRLWQTTENCDCKFYWAYFFRFLRICFAWHAFLYHGIVFFDSAHEDPNFLAPSTRPTQEV